MTFLKRLLIAPAAYAGWAGLVLIALVATYPVDPYVFGFTTLILGWISAVPLIAGIGVAFFAKGLTTSARVMISLSVIISAAALGVALAILRNFKWA
jgi:Sec-independent protein secretion pathway component TatC